MARNAYRPASKRVVQALLETCKRAGIDEDDEIPISDHTSERRIRIGKLVVYLVCTRKPHEPERHYYDIALSDKAPRLRLL
jgi:hypothetical protein